MDACICENCTLEALRDVPDDDDDDDDDDDHSDDNDDDEFNGSDNTEIQ